MTLLQQKNRPVHELRPRGKSIVPHTYCGVDPCRKGICTFGVIWGIKEVTCKECLKIKRQEHEKAS